MPASTEIHHENNSGKTTLGKPTPTKFPHTVTECVSCSSHMLLTQVGYGFRREATTSDISIFCLRRETLLILDPQYSGDHINRQSQ